MLSLQKQKKMIKTPKYNGIDFTRNFSRKTAFFDAESQREMNIISDTNGFLSFFYKTTETTAPTSLLSSNNNIFSPVSATLIDADSGGFVYYFAIPQMSYEKPFYFILKIGSEIIYSEYCIYHPASKLGALNICQILANNNDIRHGYLTNTSFGFFKFSELDSDVFATEKTVYKYSYSRNKILSAENQITKQLLFINLTMYQKNLLKWLCNCENLYIDGKEYQLISEITEVGKADFLETCNLQATFAEVEQSFFVDASNSAPKFDNLFIKLDEINGDVNYNDGYTRVFLDVNANFGLSYSVYLTKTGTSTLKIINDETNTEIATTSANGNVTIPIIFANGGAFRLRIETTENYSLNNGRTLGDTRQQNYCLKKIYLGEKITSIGTNAFQQCFSLQNIVIPSSVTSIGANAFQQCSSLQSVVIPSSVTSIGTNTFYQCYSLQSVVILSSVTSIGTNAFNQCFSLQSVVIPSSVTSIGANAFYQCYLLQNIVIPSSVTSIGTNAFNSANEIYEIILQSTTPTALLNVNVFANMATYVKFYVPDANLDAYKTATNWITYASKIYAISTRL